MSILGYLKDMFKNPARYNKFWVALGTALLNLATVYFPTEEWVPVLITFAGTFGVFYTKNAK